MFPFEKTVKSLGRARLYSLMLACAGLAIAFVVLMVGGITWVTDYFVNIEKGWLDSLVNWVVGSIGGIVGWFMLPAFVVLIAGVFQGTTIQRVEHIDYPDAESPGQARFWPDLFHDIRFTIWALFLNLLVLPLYLFGIGFIISVALNSYLLGREFFESAAGGHVGKPEAKKLGHKYRGVVYGGGLVFTLMALIPIVNLFVPVFAIVWMVHVYHGLHDDSARTMTA